MLHRVGWGTAGDWRGVEAEGLAGLAGLG
jgi:hypothetical protein